MGYIPPKIFRTTPPTYLAKTCKTAVVLFSAEMSVFEGGKALIFRFAKKYEFCKFFFFCNSVSQGPRYWVYLGWKEWSRSLKVNLVTTTG